MIELTAACMVLAIVVSSTVPCLVASNRQRRKIIEREVALVVIHNTLERLASTPPEELTDVAAQVRDLPEWARDQLSGAALTAQVDTPSPEGLRRVIVEMAWRADAHPQGRRPLAVTTWLPLAEDDHAAQ